MVLGDPCERVETHRLRTICLQKGHSHALRANSASMASPACLCSNNVGKGGWRQGLGMGQEALLEGVGWSVATAHLPAVE